MEELVGVFVNQISNLLLNADKEIELSNVSKAWRNLEEAHILSQPYALMHVLVHFQMLKLAIKTTNFSEIWGQFLRILVAAPGSWLGKYPLGNTGRSDVSMFKPMPISNEIKSKMEQVQTELRN